MAQPTTNIKYIEFTSEEQDIMALKELQAAVVERQEALERLLQVIQDLHESGIFDILHGLLVSKEKIAGILLEQILKPSVLGTVKNAMTAMGTVSKIDPNQLSTLTEALVSGLEAGQERLESNKKAGMFELAKALRDPGMNRALVLMLGFLQGLGQAL
ncbi:DUF1641 domain-containing protein [Alicyclobacillus ferrooxydans]|uniref:DUF1641 domain-containing protein n=1 Tax=Alicyclobacillus ferrooxydans TaxID=471514 RepID=A0A0P9CIE3_9BACL|nr:DUF1641 domain-containing protein [Alicyclobacillus ferrooxydans]KPV45200.1 hypothetical protein AN477_03405 [Alicyclobacillus ferrooxydans]